MLLLGLPGKLGLKGDQVFEQFRLGNIGGIRDYCESDVLNTYLVYLRFQLIRGQLSQEQYGFECELLNKVLQDSGKPHLEEFQEAWMGLSKTAIKED